MKRVLASLSLIVAVATLSGCYYDPGYSYVRSNGYGGDAYYGQGAPVYNDGYYAAPGYYDGYYGGYYGCCYAPGLSLGISGAWYGGSGYWRGRRGGYGNGYGYRGQGGHWQGSRSSGGSHRGGNPHGDSHH